MRKHDCKACNTFEGVRYNQSYALEQRKIRTHITLSTILCCFLNNEEVNEKRNG